MVWFSVDGKEDLLAAVHGPRRADGHPAAALVEPRAHLAAAGVLLVGCLSQRMD